MKIPAALLVLIAASEYLVASAGPPPFRNESPLITGTDGIYQAIATGVNLSGVFSFQISGGIQTASANLNINSWVFFLEGQIIQGTVSAAISEGKVLGILDGGVNPDVPITQDGQLVLPTAFVIPGDAASGKFNGSINYRSPLGAFQGSGVLMGAPARQDQLVTISGGDTTPTNTFTNTATNTFTNTATNTFTNTATNTTTNATTNTFTNTTTNTGTNTFTNTFTNVSTNDTNGVDVDVTVLEFPASTFPETRFKFHGTRVSTAPILAAAPAASPSPSDTSQ
jgi:hypothetical protein